MAAVSSSQSADSQATKRHELYGIVHSLLERFGPRGSESHPSKSWDTPQGRQALAEACNRCIIAIKRGTPLARELYDTPETNPERYLFQNWERMVMSYNEALQDLGQKPCPSSLRKKIEAIAAQTFAFSLELHAGEFRRNQEAALQRWFWADPPFLPTVVKEEDDWSIPSPAPCADEEEARLRAIAADKGPFSVGGGAGAAAAAAPYYGGQTGWALSGLSEQEQIDWAMKASLNDFAATGADPNEDDCDPEASASPPSRPLAVDGFTPKRKKPAS